MSEIEAKVLKTKNINETIETFALQNKISTQECDFTILSTENYVRDNATNELELIKKELLPEYLNKDKILNEHITFHQVYKIKVFHQKTCTLKLQYKIDFGEHSTHPKIILSPNSHIPHKVCPAKDLLILLFREFNKIKIANGILINVFDGLMKHNLKSFVKYLYLGKFKKPLKLVLFDGISPSVTREAKLIYWYEEKNTQSTVVEVEENELLVEFKKPIFGVNGLNAFGEEVSSNTVNNSNDLEVEIDLESIKIKENSNAKQYISKKQGFVHFESGKLSVNNTIKVSKISRNNRAIASEEENNIKVVVSQNDTNKDSVGEGVALTSETINVNGFVGAGSKLEAINLNIDGATHQDAIQFAKYAKINRHKGTLRCHEAHITLLEGGEVHATNVNIETCLGGSVYAQDVTIGHVKNNLKVYASHSIKIRHISGEDNIFTINYRNVPILKSKVQHIDEDIEDLKYHLEEAQRHKIQDVPKITSEIKKLEKEVHQIQDSYKTATVSIEKPLRGLNKIIFTIDSENEIMYKTDAKEYKPFYLEINDDKITLQPVNLSINLEN